MEAHARTLGDQRQRSGAGDDVVQHMRLLPVLVARVQRRQLHRDARIGADVAVGAVRGDGGDRLAVGDVVATRVRSEEHTSELQSLMRISYAVFCLKKKKT